MYNEYNEALFNREISAVQMINGKMLIRKGSAKKFIAVCTQQHENFQDTGAMTDRDTFSGKITNIALGYIATVPKGAIITDDKGCKLIGKSEYMELVPTKIKQKPVFIDGIEYSEIEI